MVISKAWYQIHCIRFSRSHSGIYEEYGFDKKIETLKKNDKWKEIEFFKSDYIASKDVNAWLGLYEVIK